MCPLPGFSRRPNPSPEQPLQKAWQLMIATISHFPPPKGMDDFVAYFVRNRAPPDMAPRLERLFAQVRTPALCFRTHSA